MQELAKQPFGKILVWGIALGMLLLVVWRLTEAQPSDIASTRRSKRTWLRLASGAKVVVYIALGVLAVRVALVFGELQQQLIQSSPRGYDREGDGTCPPASGLWWPSVSVSSCNGVGVIGQARMAGGFRRRSSRPRASWAGAVRGYIWLGKVGHFAKGLVLMGVGALICYAGVTHEPQKSGGLRSQALQKVLQQPFGPYLLFAVGIGIACYGLFSWRRPATSTGDPAPRATPFPRRHRRGRLEQWRADRGGAMAAVAVGRLRRRDARRTRWHPGAARARRGRRRVRIDHLSVRPGGDRPGAGHGRGASRCLFVAPSSRRDSSSRSTSGVVFLLAR